MNMKRSALISIGLLLIVGCGRAKLPQPPSTQSLLEQEVAKQKENIPRVLSPGVTCRELIAGNQMVVCSIEVTNSVLKALQDPKQGLRELTAKQFSEDKELHRFSSLGVRLHCKLFDSSKEFLYDFTFDAPKPEAL